MDKIIIMNYNKLIQHLTFAGPWRFERQFEKYIAIMNINIKWFCWLKEKNLIVQNLSKEVTSILQGALSMRKKKSIGNN